MVLVEGTNCGFVLVAPTSDPAGDSDQTIDAYKRAVKHTSPVGAIQITELGWYCDNATEAADYDIGIYTHNVGDDNPEAAVSISASNAKGTGSGWKVVSGLNITITPSTIYWIAVECDNTATATNMDRTAAGGVKADYIASGDSLPDPWGVSQGTAVMLLSMYALYSAPATGGLDGQSATPYVY